MPGAGPVPDAGDAQDENLGGGAGAGIVDNLASQVTRRGGESRLALRAFAPPRRGHFFIRKKPPVWSTRGSGGFAAMSVITIRNTKRRRPPELVDQAATNCVANPLRFRGSKEATTLDRGHRGWLSSQARGTGWLCRVQPVPAGAPAAQLGI